MTDIETPDAPPLRPPPWEAHPPEAIAAMRAANDKVAHQNLRVLQAKQVVEDSKSAQKGCEHDRDDAVRELQQVINYWTSPEQPTLFNQPAEDESWRAEPLAKLKEWGGLTDAGIEGLNAAAIFTVGDLADWLKGPPQRQYTDLPGCGEKKAEKLELAMEEFWRWAGRGTVESPVPAGPNEGEVLE